jgi:hypothetical protein
VFRKATLCSPTSAREVLNTALQKYRPGRSDPILVGGITLLKPALQLMTSYRLVIEEVTGSEVRTSYTRWVESVQLREAENQEVYLTFSPRFERIWLESKERLPQYVAKEPANIGQPNAFGFIVSTLNHLV